MSKGSTRRPEDRAAVERNWERTFKQRTVVVHRREPHDVYIGRPSKWGNPFHIGAKHGDRAAVIAKYAAWIQTQPHLLAALGELRGKRLGCYCAPLACHGDVLARLADALGDEDSPNG